MYRFRDTLPIDISEQTISGDLVTIANPEEMGVVDSLEVSLSPIQDLNGYDNPWVGGAGKNLIPYPYYDSTGTVNGVTRTVNSDGSVTFNGTATASVYFNFVSNNTPHNFKAGSYIFNVNGGATNPLIAGVTMSVNVRVGSNNKYNVNLNTGTQSANFTPQEDGLLRCYVAITSGTTVNNLTIKPMIRLASDTDATFEPYTNVCPISGRTEVVTQRTGKNLLNPTLPSGTSAGVTATRQSDKSYRLTGTATSIAVNIWIAGGYITNPSTQLDNFKLLYLKAGTVVTFKDCKLFFYDIETGKANTNFGHINVPIGSNARTLTVPHNAWLTGVRIPDGVVGETYNTTVYPQLELGSTATDYEPYGNTYTTALGRTIYGGSLDVVSGVLTVTHGNIASYNGETLPSTWISDRDVYASGTTPTTGAQVVYELAEPQTYQLTPQQIDLLLGTNHLWSDGEISVVWHKDLTKGRILPTEAVSINGQYIENVLEGYRTLYTKGRESLGAELNTYSVGTADGEKFKNKRYPARELTVGFQLIADNAEDFREKFNNLNNLLAIEEADFIFHDEEDKFFSGYPIMNAEVEAGENSVKGEWKIYCAYPFKRSVEPITLTMEDAAVTNTTATFTIDYKGARPARPVLRAKFAGAKSGGSSSEDGDCGFVAFMDGEENIVQLGNPDVLDLDEYASAETLINKEFVNVSDWTRTGGHTYKGTVTGSVSTSDTVDAFWNGGKGQTQSYAKPTYGSGTGLHGSILWKNTAGAVNFTLNAVHRLCVNNSNETGVFEVGAYNHSTGKMVAGFVIDKSGNGTTGVVRYIVNSKQVGTDQIDLSYYNNHFGYCNRTPVYVQQTYYDPVQQTYKVQVKTKKKKKKKKYVTKSRTVWVARTRTVQNGWNYTQSNLNSSIEKDGAYIYFQVGNLPLRTFNVPDVAQVVAHDASVFMGTYGTAMNTNMIHSLLFRREAGVPFAEQPNVFTAGDIVEADCNEATVYIYRDGSIGGHLEPQYGALGNDWEDFLLTSGTNVIRATWSDWVNPTYKPQIEIEYNEVFI